MKLGVVGLPNVGKSTLFNAITKAGAEIANYPFCTIEPNVGTVAVPDARLQVLADLYKTKQIVPAVLEFVDIAGLVRGAAKGEGLGNKFLAHIREVDAIVHVVRCFEDANITHVSGRVSPKDDIETIDIELCLADLETVTKRIDKAQKSLRSGDKKAEEELALLNKIKPHLENGKPVRTIELSQEQRALVKTFFLLTAKPVIYAANISENDIKNTVNEYVIQVQEYAKAENSGVLVISAKIEEELAQMSDEDKLVFFEELGLSESGLDRLIKEGYRLLGLMSFLTAGEKEVRAWTIKKGTKAPEAAGKIHTDMEKGFIRAEIVSYDDLVAFGSVQAVKEKGRFRSEGRDYVFAEGDVVLFRFNR